MAAFTFALQPKVAAVKSSKDREGMIPCPAHGTDGHPAGCGTLTNGRYVAKDGSERYYRPSREDRDRDREDAHYWYGPTALAMHLASSFDGGDETIAATVNAFLQSRKDPRRIRAIPNAAKGERRFVDVA